MIEDVIVKGVLVLELKNKAEWIRYVPNHLPEQRHCDEHFLWVDKNGNSFAMGRDFIAAEIAETYPCKVYRLQYVADAYTTNAAAPSQREGAQSAVAEKE